MKEWERVPLSYPEREVIETAATELKARFPVETVILFGSKARGDADEYSDIDLLVVTSRALDWREEKGVVDLLFDIGMETNAIFTPLFASTEEWTEGPFREFPIYREIVGEGAVVS
jgi:predicted nucleotidyltransferase